MAEVVTVFGATGSQGGGVANALLEDPKFNVRIVTRSASTDKAKALQERGAGVIEGNFDDASSLERALQGTYGTFVMTQHSFEDPNFDQLEIKQVTGVADAAKAAGVQHVVFSSLEDVQKIMGFPCLHYDSKAQIEDYMKSIGLPLTIVKYPGYYENYISLRLVQKLEDDTYEIAYPLEGAAKHGISVADAGFAVGAIFENRAEWLGRTVGFSADKLTIQQHADILSKHLAPRVFKPSKLKDLAEHQILECTSVFVHYPEHPSAVLRELNSLRKEAELTDVVLEVEGRGLKKL
ncbi:PREDICTED: nmrA-like family domain-containing protein 1 [Branchiostoma belcheri]|uniref:NmrA-like family domain-containing protein 1 n=1 Tax=Branchiostoma belcheri TaxID=7741 RepID=A0A6P4Y985_BRABE|nr:PREDICTED: nmrA-like family domain-containing protein 1 [Branchiostoma belcheri]